MAKSWHLLVTRRIGVQVAQQWNHAFWKMRAPYGIGIDDIRIDFDGRRGTVSKAPPQKSP